MSVSQCVVLDNGGNTIKAGYAGQKDPRVIPNTIARHAGGKSDKDRPSYVGDQLESECNNYTSLLFRRPIDKGYLVNCNVEGEIWGRAFGPQGIQVEAFEDTALLVTEPPFNPPTLRRDTCEMALEKFGFKCMSLASTAYLSLIAVTHEQQLVRPDEPSIFAQTKTALVIDSGFSFSHVVPILGGSRVMRQVRRVDIGGKAMTNYLKEVVSMRREFNMMDETYLMNDAKEKSSFVSLDFTRDLRRAQEDNIFVRRYVLPDYISTMIGRLKKSDEPFQRVEQIVSLDHERFAVPELLFTPSDIGLNQAGIAETAVESVFSDPLTSDEQKQLLLDSIVLVGGNTCIPNYQQRMYQEIRKLTPTDYDVTIYEPQNPITCAWKGGSLLMSTLRQRLQEDIATIDFMVSREEYEEHGMRIIAQKCRL